MTDEQHHEPEGNTTIITVYGLLCFGLICSMTPIIPVFLMGTMLIPFTLFLAWALRFGKSRETLIFNHMIYISRTIWMFSIILTVTTALAGFLVSTGADNTLLNSTISDMMNGILYSHDQLYDILMEYIRINSALMISAVALCTLPTMGYIIYRLAKGMGRAFKGYRLAKPEAWF